MPWSGSKSNSAYILSDDLHPASFPPLSPLARRGGARCRSDRVGRLAALGGLLCERAGVFNLALEGLILTGAFAAVLGSAYGGSFAGVGAAVLASAATAALLALFVVGAKGDEVVVGIAIGLGTHGLSLTGLVRRQGCLS